ncbi:hypothetical protein [Corynebacterium heidelbergense]|uniref:Uncharacterized protein n=1 Tax=Corynebacterium heidelbergense TaxID=2055947 RepID=A0A364VDP3_9CORY|nr:hypothetical protein [Corynebacterium heidelbergense]RAV34741.1 hypothetical protein CWC39_01450 [Corynebacterium heidelbergense]WCZ37000.1 hypothetical protein CHEID_07335 [Corynebacterium heidelbergense]
MTQPIALIHDGVFIPTDEAPTDPRFASLGSADEQWAGYRLWHAAGWHAARSYTGGEITVPHLCHLARRLRIPAYMPDLLATVGLLTHTNRGYLLADVAHTTDTTEGGHLDGLVQS